MSYAPQNTALALRGWGATRTGPLADPNALTVPGHLRRAGPGARPWPTGSGGEPRGLSHIAAPGTSSALGAGTLDRRLTGFPLVFYRGKSHGGGVSQNGCFRTFFQIVFLTLASDLARFLCYMWLSRPSDEHLGPVLEASQGSVIWCIFPGAEPQVSLSGICKACPAPHLQGSHTCQMPLQILYFSCLCE